MTTDMIQLESLAEQVPYAIPGNDAGGRLMVYGNKAAPYILFFCAGYPDSVHAFLPMASKMAAENDCLCGVACLPGYDVHHENWKPQGYTFEEIVTSLREATKVLKGLSTNDDKAKFVAVLHDWGCAMGGVMTNRLLLEDPNSVSKIVHFDIMPFLHKDYKVPKKTGLSKQLIVSLSYQGLFAVSFALQRFVSFYLAAPTFSIGNLVLQILGLMPTSKCDADTFKTHVPKYSLRKMIYMAYPYLEIFTSKMKVFGTEYHLPQSMEKTPVLYMYGLDKRIHFHDPKHLEWLEEESKKEECKSKVVAVEKAGHWLYLQRPEICYEEAKKFVFDS